MKINSIQNPNVVNSYKNNLLNPVGKSLPQTRLDEVSISEEAIRISRSLSGIREQLTTRSPEELARIADIKERIQNGTYHVDTKDIVDKIVSKFEFE